MAEIVLFHHVQGLTPGIRSFADKLRAAGHRVHTPDLFDGRTFETIESGLEFMQTFGFETAIQRGEEAVRELPPDLVYGGFSLGVLPAQKLAQTRPGARGALLFHSFVEPAALGSEWPIGLPVQIHTMEGDPYFESADQATARRFIEAQHEAELFIYPGKRHLFTDASVAEYDAEATATVLQRVLAFLDRLDRC